MSSAARRLPITPAQYLVRERAAPTRSEYCNGVITAMAGTSRKHNLVAGNLFREISSQLRDRPCEVYFADMRLCVDATGLYTYPDLMVVCGEPSFQDSELDTLLNPIVIVEVLSPTTESYDRGGKFIHYRRLESLREYVLVAQDRVFAERYTRQGAEWVLKEFSDPDGSLRLDSIGCEVAMREIYAKVRFDEDETVGGGT